MGKSTVIAETLKNILPLKKLGVKIILATDSQEILEECSSFPVEAVLTSLTHKSGTDRVREAALKFKNKFILNVQGDEPFMDTELIKSLCTFHENNSFDISTCAFRSSRKEDFESPNRVKTILDTKKRALYFSRSPIPCSRDRPFKSCLIHQGIYAYNFDSLQYFCNFPQSFLEGQEKLEQLRALENSMSIGVLETKKFSEGIDTDEDLKLARKKYKSHA